MSHGCIQGKNISGHREVRAKTPRLGRWQQQEKRIPGQLEQGEASGEGLRGEGQTMQDLTAHPPHPHPLQIDNQRSRLPISLAEGRLRVYQSGTRAIVELNFGLVVTYDWDCQLALSLPERFQSQVCGLCGNYNNNPDDDFLTYDSELVSDPVEFANSWKLDDEDYLCDDGCQNNCPSCTPGQAQHYEGNRLCGMLTQADGPFAACHSALPPRPFLEECVYDLCVVNGDRASLCRSLSAYAQACQELGISVGNWRPLAHCRE